MTNKQIIEKIVIENIKSKAGPETHDHPMGWFLGLVRRVNIGGTYIGQCEAPTTYFDCFIPLEKCEKTIEVPENKALTYASHGNIRGGLNYKYHFEKKGELWEIAEIQRAHLPWFGRPNVIARIKSNIEALQKFPDDAEIREKGKESLSHYANRIDSEDPEAVKAFRELERLLGSSKLRV